MSDRETPLTDAVNSGEWDSLEIRYDLMHDLAEDLERKLADAREALEWYGEQARLARLIHAEGDAGRRAIDRDGGNKAREALARIDGNIPAHPPTVGCGEGSTRQP